MDVFHDPVDFQAARDPVFFGLGAQDSPYERMGDVSNVTFPCGATVAADGDTILTYYGAADTTPLFLVLLDEYERWTGDKTLVRRLESQARNYQKWTTLNSIISPSPLAFPTYQQHLDHLKSWITQRLVWIDSHFLPGPIFSHNGACSPSSRPHSTTANIVR